MSWRSSTELREELDRTELVGAASELYALSVILGTAFPAKDYPVAADWSTDVVPSPSGRSILDAACMSAPYPPSVTHFILFEIFFHDELLINLSETNTNAIRARISAELRSRALLLPYRYGRVLYDKFNSSPELSTTEHLDAQQTWSLLDGTPQGVYQMGTLVAGPLGILESSTRRYTPPVRSLPLWHCSDTGCSAIHHVDLSEYQGPLERGFYTITRYLSDECGPAAEWSLVLGRLQRDNTQGTDYYDLLPVLADALTEEDRTQLLLRLLASSAAPVLRAALSGADGDDRRSRGAPSEVVRRLTDAERLQLLMTLPDDTLVEAVDRLVLNDIIRVPIHEVRRSRFKPPSFGRRDIDTEMSSLGMRPAHQPAILNLVSQVWRAYEDSGALEELGWKLRRQSGTPQRSALLDRFRTGTPQDAVRDLVLSSMRVTHALARQLRLNLETYQENPLFGEIRAGIFTPPRLAAPANPGPGSGPRPGALELGLQS